MKLRKAFSKKVEAIRDNVDRRRDIKNTKRRLCINNQLAALAGGLSAELNRNPVKRVMSYSFSPPLGSNEVRTLSSYKRLHEVCAAANVQIENENVTRHISLTMTANFTHITINPNKPYASSSDASFFFPGSVGVQLKFPGL